jgi:hypothetical protein
LACLNSGWAKKVPFARNRTARVGVVGASVHKTPPGWNTSQKTVRGTLVMVNGKRKRAAKVIPESSLSDQFPGEPGLDRAIQDRIGDHLRSMYDELVQQPVPDRFVELLNRLEKRNDSAEP